MRLKETGGATAERAAPVRAGTDGSAVDETLGWAVLDANQVNFLAATSIAGLQ